MIDIKTQYAGLTLRNPIIVGSSGLTNKAERNRDFEKAGAGAIVLKSLFEEQIEIAERGFDARLRLPRSGGLYPWLCKSESSK